MAVLSSSAMAGADGLDGSAAPHVVWYGDDFTGATDTLATVAQAGLLAMLFLGVPSAEQLHAVGPLQAIGIAGAARSMDAAQMRQELIPVADFMAASGARVLHYKCCSTFDSAPHVGSIGEAVRMLRRSAYYPLVAVVGGQPSLGRYCAFGHLFARAGQESPVYRLDRHPTMSVHPVTPMRESDLRHHLAQQGLEAMTLLSVAMHGAPLSACDFDGQAAQDAAWAQWMDVQCQAAARADAVLLDVTAEYQQAAIGRLLWRCAQQAPLLAVGPSSVEQSLVAGWRSRGEWQADAPATGCTALAPAQGPVFTLVGSLSPVSARQMAASRCYAMHEIDVARLLQEPGYAAHCVQAWVTALRQGQSVLAHTSVPSVALNAAMTSAVAQASARLVATVVNRMAQIGQRLYRVGIVGGDTSSHAAQALGLWGLGYHSRLASGVTMSIARSDDARMDGLELMLKGGQMGDDGLLDRLVTGGSASST